MEEIWKDIPNYEGYYQASNLGRIKSVDRKVKCRDFTILRSGNVLSQSKNGRGYLYVGFDGKAFKVSQLVAMAFLNHKRCGMKRVVHHIDNNKMNNNASNLQIVSQRENSYTHSVGSSKYRGVGFRKDRNKWRAYIRINGNMKHLGYYNKEYDAHLAYENALKQLL